jgi:signal transduction histidine kinase
VREIQALEAPHIAEVEDAAMTSLEEQMAASEAAAGGSLAELSSLLGPAAREALGSARAELDRFAELQKQIVSLSRQNTDVRSLAVALGSKRRLTAACDATLAALQEALAKRGSRATR